MTKLDLEQFVDIAASVKKLKKEDLITYGIDIRAFYTLVDADALQWLHDRSDYSDVTIFEWLAGFVNCWYKYAIAPGEPKKMGDMSSDELPF